MASVEILGPLELFSETVVTIQEAGLMHLEEVPLFSEGDSVKLHRIHLRKPSSASARTSKRSRSSSRTGSPSSRRRSGSVRRPSSARSTGNGSGSR